jgi:hypothetical protein
MANESRRKFMRHSLLGMAAIPLGMGILSQRAFAQSLTPLDPSTPQAKGLNYVKVAEEAVGHPAYAAGEHCANCMLFQEATNGCSLFPQNMVETNGWCQVWAPKS